MKKKETHKKQGYKMVYYLLDMKLAWDEKSNDSQMVIVTRSGWLPYSKLLKALKILFSEPLGQLPRNLVCSIIHNS